MCTGQASLTRSNVQATMDGVDIEDILHAVLALRSDTLNGIASARVFRIRPEMQRTNLVE